MKFLADVNLPRIIANEVRNNNHDVKELAKSKLREISDEDVAKLAKQENRILLTYDKDFLPGGVVKIVCRVVIFHFPLQKPQVVLLYINSLLNKLSKIRRRKSFVVILTKDTVQVINI